MGIADGKFRLVRLAAGGIAPVPLRLTACKMMLQGKSANMEASGPALNRLPAPLRVFVGAPAFCAAELKPIALWRLTPPTWGSRFPPGEVDQGNCHILNGWKLITLGLCPGGMAADRIPYPRLDARSGCSALEGMPPP